ncbi:hypothetical protein PYCCODRAFT_1370942 [Trametes coccinea BRFM310]|uniref:F-box domain-containing protein n=1 Tax=Trametes coccinea (strain BRFM310) TaxID=1353009 RepID=A0A1Y2IHG3_TRAC3|nr:hypothetical protein PYCCODRAFT_1370942 [Trametes coccinea BRFM310]
MPHLACATTRSSICSLPLEVLDDIAYHLALLEPVGPPRHLPPLLRTCKSLHTALCVTNNTHLYARIFRAKFDHRAAERRFCQEASYSSGLAYQLVAYCHALRNISRGDIDSPTTYNDYMRAFTMCMENDGRNAQQLEWAGLRDHVERFIFDRLWDERDRANGWPVEDITNSLALWLYWYSLTEGYLASKTPLECAMLMALVRPYAIYNFRYPPFLAPDNHIDLPLEGDPEIYREHSTLTPHGFYPTYRDPVLCKHSIMHYGRIITLAEPPIGLIAKLLYIAIQERVRPVEVNMPIPIDRAEADELGTPGPTQADYLEFAQTRAVVFNARGSWDWRAGLVDAVGALEDERAWRRDGASVSAAHENDWERWRGCYDPWSFSAPRGIKYTFGSLTGFWSGRSLDPDGNEYYHAASSKVFDEELENPTQPNVPEHHLTFKLREHHCISPATPLPHPSPSSDPLDEGIMNGYFPPSFPDWPSVTERGGRLFIHGRRDWVYETHFEGKPTSHDEETCEICRESRRVEDAERALDVQDDETDDAQAQMEEARRVVQEALGETMDVEDLISSVASDDDDTGSILSSASSTGETEIFRTCSGILDIIITGETLTRHALAWGDYRIYGRVRSWDGLVVLVRAPALESHLPPPDPDRRDTAIFRGYLVGGTNLVGAWRNVTDSVHTIPVEGPFVVSKTVETPLPSPQQPEVGAAVAHAQ